MSQRPPKPKWYQSNAFALIFVAAFILVTITLSLYFGGIDPVIAEFYIFQ